MRRMEDELRQVEDTEHQLDELVEYLDAMGCLKCFERRLCEKDMERLQVSLLHADQVTSRGAAKIECKFTATTPSA